MAFNRNFKPILIDEANQGSIWGKVTYIIIKRYDHWNSGLQ